MNNPLERLKQIADKIRSLPSAFRIYPDTDESGESEEKAISSSGCSVGGNLLGQAIELGAFSGPEYYEFQLQCQDVKSRNPDSWETSIFGLAMCRFTPALKDAGLGNEPVGATWRECCDSIADALQADIRRMETTSQSAKTEQGEGNGGKDSPPNEAAAESGVDKEATLKGMQPADRKRTLHSYMPRARWARGCRTAKPTIG
ncbi:MAG: hypothetical protein GX594_06510 [Pirellulaceae bacterium]|nr:hypothetical protein [Pirellulaceae bacterium]